MQLSERLKMVAGFVTPGLVVADIGTDHGYVPIELVQKGIVKKAYAMDINKGPIERAKEHIKQENLSGYIETRLSNGLAALKCGEAESIIIAGMGGELTVKILEAGRDVLASVKEIILSPHSEIELVRKYLIHQGYEIVKEDMVLDAGKYYTVMKAERTEKTVQELKNQYRNPAYYLYGLKLIQEGNPVLIDFLCQKEKKYQMILEEITKKAGNHGKERIEELTKDIEYMRETMVECKGGKNDEGIYTK
jgi:tRNA (adenine22-N1)-methyltransferase